MSMPSAAESFEAGSEIIAMERARLVDWARHKFTRATMMGTMVGSLLVPGAVGADQENMPEEPTVAAGTVTPFTTERQDATAVVNLTVTQTQAAAFFQILPIGEVPGSYSNLNAYKPDQTVAGQAFVKTDGGGKAGFFNQAPAHEIVDVVGYMAPGAFEDVPDVRLVDTRTFGPHILARGTITVIKGKPNSTGMISIVAVNVVTPGYIELFESPDQVPGSASVANTDTPGQINSSLAAARFNADGLAYVYNQGASDLVVDLQGYLGDGQVNDIADDRVLDTRIDFEGRPAGKVPAGSKITIQGLPNSTGFVRLVAPNAAGPGFVQDTSSGEAEGATSNLNTEGPDKLPGSLLFVPFDAEGKGSFYTTVTTDMVADVQLYLASGAFDNTKDRRVLDTRSRSPIPDPEPVPNPIACDAIAYNDRGTLMIRKLDRSATTVGPDVGSTYNNPDLSNFDCKTLFADTWTGSDMAIDSYSPNYSGAQRLNLAGMNAQQAADGKIYSRNFNTVMHNGTGSSTRGDNAADVPDSGETTVSNSISADGKFSFMIEKDAAGNLQIKRYELNTGATQRYPIPVGATDVAASRHGDKVAWITNDGIYTYDIAAGDQEFVSGNKLISNFVIIENIEYAGDDDRLFTTVHTGPDGSADVYEKEAESLIPFATGPGDQKL